MATALLQVDNLQFIDSGSNALVKFLATSNMVTMSSDLGSTKVQLSGLDDPTADTHAATKSYVDALVTGMPVKANARAASTENGALATAFENGEILDGVTLATGDIILLKDQTDAKENGLHVVNASGAPTRTADMPTGSNAAGVFVFVTEGTVNEEIGYVCSTNAPNDVVGTNTLAWVIFATPGAISAGDGMTKTGTVIDVNYDNVGVNLDGGNALQIKDAGVVEVKIATDAVTTAKIAADAVTTAKIAALNVTSAELAADSVLTAKILNSNVTNAKLATDAVTTIKITDANVTADKLATDSVTTGKIAASAVTTAKIAALNVTSAELAADAVLTAKIMNANVTAGKLATDSVTTAKIAADAVTTAKIAALNVTSAELAANSVTTGKILDANVTNAKLANAALTVAVGDGITGGGSTDLGTSCSAIAVDSTVARTDVAETFDDAVTVVGNVTAQTNLLLTGAAANKGYAQFDATTAPTVKTNKLYNVAGVLTWNDDAVNTNAVDGRVTTGSLDKLCYYAAAGNVVSDAGGITVTGSQDGLTMTGTCQAVSHTSTSDRNLKTNLRRLSDPLGMLDELNGYYFHWRSSVEKKAENREIGVMAQEVQQVLPEVVRPSSCGKFLTVMYDKMVPLLIECVKEQQTQIKELQAGMAVMRQSNIEG